MIDLYVGTYANRGGEGLFTLSLRDGSFELSEPDRLIQNASFVVYSPKHDLYYAVDEREEGVLNVLRYADAWWSILASCSTRGAGPCFVALNGDETALAVANYDSGSVVTFPIDAASGLVVDEPVVHANEGSGPHFSRQQGPHAHCAIFRGARVYSTDLGTDEVLMHEGGVRRTAFRAPPGEGPRHLLFHPVLPIAYLLTELGNTIFVLGETETGAFVELERLSALPHKFSGSSKAAHLTINAAGDRLYASNRGHDSIAAFRIDPGGKLALEQIAETGGASPRCLLLLEDQNLLLAAHEDSGSVSVTKLDPGGAMGDVVCVLAIKGAAFIGEIRNGSNSAQ